MIRKISLVAVAVALAAVFAYAQGENKTVKITGYVIDNACAETHSTEADAKVHATSCALMPGCQKSGYAVVSGDKSYKLDENGNKLMTAALKGTKTKKGVKVEVEGTLEGETLHADKLSQVK
jgi:type 1 fimbria pilin